MVGQSAGLVLRPGSVAVEVVTAACGLRGVTFEWIEPQKHGNRTGPRMGMIAQEVEQVFPDWVTTDHEALKNRIEVLERELQNR